jgi:hypothetical protein
MAVPDNEVRLEFGDSGHLNLRRSSRPGTVDHVGIRLESFEKASVTQHLKASEIVPIDEASVPGTPGFHVVDPDGFKVQLI